LIALAKGAGIPVVVDPKGRNYARYAGADVVTPNRQELSSAADLPADNEANLVTAGRALIERFDIGAVLVTCGAQGMTLVSRERADHFPARAREVYDVSGAGDTVTAVLAAAVAGGVPVAQAVELANVAAGIAVGKLGTAAVYAEELRHALHAGVVLAAESKVASFDQASRQVARWREAGLRIGFTNGCFDLLHPGHVSLLTQSRAACDRLIVGLNSDASVSRLKGPGRPAQGEIARAAVLASLAPVDLVVVFEQDTPLALIEALRPDVLIKGADYARENVVGGDYVASYGGTVVLADLVPGYSTTATLSKLGK